MTSLSGRSVVVTGAGKGVGRACAQRLLELGAGVVAVDVSPSALEWAAGTGVVPVAGDATAERTTGQAIEAARALGPLTGWVNNAAVFTDAALHTDDLATVLRLIHTNLDLAVAGCAAAVRAFLADGTAGAIVNVSSHQAQRPVPGCLPYATAKAGIEGLTRAVAADYGEHGIRANAVALGTIAVERYRDDIAALGPDGPRIDRATGALHALGRVGQPAEVADVVAHLLGDEASFISGAVIPVDGGRAAFAREPSA